MPVRSQFRSCTWGSSGRRGLTYDQCGLDAEPWPIGDDWPLFAPAPGASSAAAGAIKHAQGLFPSNQHPMDDEVMSATQHAIESWNDGKIDLAESQLKSALAVAQQHHNI